MNALRRTLVILLGSMALCGTGMARAQEFSVLQGRWVRPDGGYTVSIMGVDPASGKLSASYSNPAPVPFAVAQATRENGVLKVYLELRAAGYNGSTYTLTYDAVQDVLKGLYFQANARQNFDVVFARAR
jgi:hypothetical protein